METVIVIIVVGLILLVVVVVILEQNKKQAALKTARANYKSSLASLKTDPTNPDLRQKTLKLGRFYSNLTRDQKGVTIFDEVALSNDIGAACAAAAAPSPATTPSLNAIPTLSIEARLRQLDDLRSQSLINDDEYSLRRGKILDEI